MNDKNDLKEYEVQPKMRFDKSNFFWGIFFLVAAVFLIIGKLDIFADFSIFKLIITVFLAAWFLQSLGKETSEAFFSQLRFYVSYTMNFWALKP